MAFSIAQIEALRDMLLRAVVTQNFGPTTYSAEPAAFGYPHFHTGVDLVLPREPGQTGIPIHALSSGVVTVIPGSTGYGNHVVIRSPNGYTYLYGHMADFRSLLFGQGGTGGPNLQTGQVVHVGDIIGHEGSTGNSSGPHLHLEIRDPSGMPVDPGRNGANIFYTAYHDLGFGGGYLPGQSGAIPPPTGTPDPRTYYPVPSPLPRNPGGTDIRFAFGRSGILGPPDPTTPPTPGSPCADGSQPPCPDQPPQSSPVGFYPSSGTFFSFLNQPGGILGPKSSDTQASILSGGIDPGKILVFIAAAFMGGVFIIVGLVKLGQEKPVAAVVQPVINVGKTGGKVAAAVAA